MKVFVLLILLFFSSLQLFAKDVHVNGYYRKDGTYVQPHYRTSPNSTKSDNYSTIGNVNPYTGKAGTVEPYNYSNTAKTSTNTKAITAAAVKKSSTGICHPKGGTYYEQTKTFTPYQSMDECIKSGGRPPKK